MGVGYFVCKLTRCLEDLEEVVFYANSYVHVMFLFTFSQM